MTKRYITAIWVNKTVKVDLGNKDHTKQNEKWRLFYLSIGHNVVCEDAYALSTGLSGIRFWKYQNGLSNPTGNKKIVCTIVKYGEKFNGHYTLLNATCSEIK